MLDSFFFKLQAAFERLDILNHPERLFNVDEFGLNTDQKAKQCFFTRGTKSSYIMNPTCGKSSFSVLACGSATGNLLPPFVVFKGLHLYASWCVGGPKGTGFACTDSGWMEMRAFEQWMEKVCRATASAFSLLLKSFITVFYFCRCLFLISKDTWGKIQRSWF